MATVRACPGCSALFDLSVENHCEQWLGNETLRTIDDCGHERSCPRCGRSHDLTIAECCGGSLAAEPVRARRRAREVILELPGGPPVALTGDTILGRGRQCPFGDRFAMHESGRYVSREHATILFEEGGPVLRVERSRNSTLLDDVRVPNGESRELTDGVELKLSTRFPSIRVRVRDLE